eukprot:13457862-Alexandrium_andersonii.AAC.1
MKPESESRGAPLKGARSRLVVPHSTTTPCLHEVFASSTDTGVTQHRSLRPGRKISNRKPPTTQPRIWNRTCAREHVGIGVQVVGP